MKIKILTSIDSVSMLTKNEIVCFLSKNLTYNEPKNLILSSIEYALNDYSAQGGFIVLAIDNTNVLIGVAIINKISTQGYYPENIIVYMASEDHNEEDIYHKLLENTKVFAKGSISFPAKSGSIIEKIANRVGFNGDMKQLVFTN